MQVVGQSSCECKRDKEKNRNWESSWDIDEENIPEKHGTGVRCKDPHDMSPSKPIVSYDAYSVTVNPVHPAHRRPNTEIIS